MRNDSLILRGLSPELDILLRQREEFRDMILHFSAYRTFLPEDEQAEVDEAQEEIRKLDRQIEDLLIELDE